MPCYDPPANERRDEHHPPGYEIRDLRKKCDKLTDMLCRLGRLHVQFDDTIPPDVLEWWQHHAAWDASRGEPWDTRPEPRQDSPVNGPPPPLQENIIYMSHSRLSLMRLLKEWMETRGSENQNEFYRDYGMICKFIEDHFPA
jgi:hypothetical protein